VPDSVLQMFSFALGLADVSSQLPPNSAPSPVAILRPEQKPEALDFLNVALDGRASTAELKGLMNRCGALLPLPNAKAVRAFLQSLADELSKDA